MLCRLTSVFADDIMFAHNGHSRQTQATRMGVHAQPQTPPRVTLTGWQYEAKSENGYDFIKYVT